MDHVPVKKPSLFIRFWCRLLGLHVWGPVEYYPGFERVCKRCHFVLDLYRDR